MRRKTTTRRRKDARARDHHAEYQRRLELRAHCERATRERGAQTEKRIEESRATVNNVDDFPDIEDRADVEEIEERAFLDDEEDEW